MSTFLGRVRARSGVSCWGEGLKRASSSSRLKASARPSAAVFSGASGRERDLPGATSQNHVETLCGLAMHGRQAVRVAVQGDVHVLVTENSATSLGLVPAASWSVAYV